MAIAGHDKRWPARSRGQASIGAAERRQFRAMATAVRLRFRVMCSLLPLRGSTGRCKVSAKAELALTEGVNMAFAALLLRLSGNRLD
jgi:hypothetical protein